VDDFSKDGTIEYSYPKNFIVNGNQYKWWVSSNHTKGRRLCTHYELWFSGIAFKSNSEKIATGVLTKTKLRKGFKRIFDYYKNDVCPDENERIKNG
jgi:hypothetical protein